MIIVDFYRVLVMLVNCECDIYLCRECSGPGIDWSDPGSFVPGGPKARRTHFRRLWLLTVVYAYDRVLQRKKSANSRQEI